MHPLDDDPHAATDRDPAPDRAALRPLRLFQTVTAVTLAQWCRRGLVVLLVQFTK